MNAKIILKGDMEKMAESICLIKQLEIQNSEDGFIPHYKKNANFVEYFEM
jgi:hypothetical protein